MDVAFSALPIVIEDTPLKLIGMFLNENEQSCFPHLGVDIER